MKLVKADPSELNRIADFVNTAYRGEYSKTGWTTEAYFVGGQRTDAETLREMLQDPDTSIWLAKEDEKLIGSVVLKQEKNHVLYLGMLTVEPALQGAGIGKWMMEEIEKVAMMTGNKELRLSVIHLRSELISYYERRGFTATGEWEEFPQEEKYGIPKQELRLMIFSKKLSSAQETDSLSEIQNNLLSVRP